MANAKKTEKPEWVKIKATELEKIIIDLANAGNSPAKIGLILRDQHGVPKAKFLGKRIGQIMKENKMHFKTEKEMIKEKLDNLNKHLGKNKRDYTASRSVTKQLWALHKLEKQSA